jgi:hypothetical protein
MYLLIKGQRSSTDVELILSIATFLSPSKIRKLDSWVLTKNEVNFNNFINRTPTTCLPIWHYKNYVKGCRNCDVWLLDGNIKTDKTIRDYLNDDYCGSIDEGELSKIEMYVRAQISLNAINKSVATIEKHLNHIDDQEKAALLIFLDQRRTSLTIQLKSMQSNFLRRNF